MLAGRVSLSLCKSWASGFVIDQGKETDARPGRALRGPSYNHLDNTTAKRSS
jgi:hypothetical protein